ncbi:ChrR family anti-sigma-E factor [Alteromonas sp. A079]|uniref:ChrR family anti-sigma-E factor n=1 Tax=Alteromonas sp. A079 TaxID=3410268 RepID=UPI003BA0E9A6
MIRFHPSSQQISEFVEGTLSPAVSLLVSAHSDMCPSCQKRIETETERLADSILEDNTAASSQPQGMDDAMSFDSMLSFITQMPASNEGDIVVAKRSARKSVSIELDGRKFELPRTLHRYTDNTGNWSSLVGKLWQAPVEVGNKGVANFIFMGQGGSVPEHTHRGNEYTLVIDGEFCDGLNSYDTGDFIYMDGNHTHTPRADKSEGCLVFSIVDQPLHFTSGLARLLNPFSHLFFK